MDVIIYNRISTDNKEQNPESNLNVCRDFCERNGYNIIDIIIDKGISGDSYYYNRKEAVKINDYINDYSLMNKPFAIVNFSIDRFSRQHPIKALAVMQDIRDKGVQILSATESIFNEENEFSLPMQFHIVWFNHYFLLQHSKKVKAGMEKKKADGGIIGRQTELDDDDIIIVKDMFSKDYTYRYIIKWFKEKKDKKVSLGYLNKIKNG